jgi:hypothetical protein
MRRRLAAVVLAMVVAAAPLAGRADEPSPGQRVKGSVTEGAKTGGRTAREGLKTFGRATGAFFRGGPAAAKKAWREGEARTKDEARAGGRATKRAAGGE